MGLRSQGKEEFHGFLIAKEIKGRKSARLLTGHGSLYRALGRLEAQGYLHSRWEDPFVAAQESRPRRRLYTLTAAGVTIGAADVPQSTSGNDEGAWMTPVRTIT